MEKLEDKKKQTKRKDKFFSAEEIENFTQSEEGLSFKAKLIGITDVTSIRGDDICEKAMAQLKCKLSLSKQHKQKINIVLRWDGVAVTEEKTEEKLHNLPLSEISFVWKDNSDSRSIGLIVVRTELETKTTNPKFYAYKTEKLVMILIKAMKTLFNLKEEEMKKSPVNGEDRKIEGLSENSGGANETDKFSTSANEVDKQLNLIDITVPDDFSKDQNSQQFISFENENENWPPQKNSTFDDWLTESSKSSLPNDPWSVPSVQAKVQNDPWLQLTSQTDEGKTDLFHSVPILSQGKSNFPSNLMIQPQSNFSNSTSACNGGDLISENLAFPSVNPQIPPNPFPVFPQPANAFSPYPQNSLISHPVYSNNLSNPFPKLGSHNNAIPFGQHSSPQTNTVFSTGRVPTSFPVYSDATNSTIQTHQIIDNQLVFPDTSQIKPTAQWSKVDDRLFEDLIPKDYGLRKATGAYTKTSSPFDEQFNKLKDKPSLNDLAKQKTNEPEKYSPAANFNPFGC